MVPGAESAGLVAPMSLRVVGIALGPSRHNATTGEDNVGMGVNTLGTLTTASDNVAIGNYAIDALTTGESNTGVGHQVLTRATTGRYNTSMGRGSQEDVTTGYQNTAHGYYAGSSITTGINNIMIGSTAGDLTTTGSNNIIIGVGIDATSATVSSELNIGNMIKGITGSGGRIHGGSHYGSAPWDITTSGQTSSWSFLSAGAPSVNMADNMGPASSFMELNRTNGTSGGKMLVFRKLASEHGNISVNESGGTSFNTSSDYRLKENVDYTWDATTRLKQLKPARFNWIADETNTLVDGFIAQEVTSVITEAGKGVKDAVKENGDVLPQGIDQSKLVPLLVKTIQELEARITALEA